MPAGPLARRIALVLVPLAITLTTLKPALGGEPADQITQQLDAAFTVLRDPSLRQPERDTERRQAIRALAETIFDFRETARRVLGPHWAERTPDEQAQFVRAFVGLIDHAYLRRVDEYGGERLVVKGQTVDGAEVKVQTQIVDMDGDTTPVEFLVARSDGDQWRAYDVKVAGMSLVANYRAQFNKIIRTGSYEELMRRLQAKSAAALQR
jgi:phospholipid transport system substrate-binding protein